MVGIWPNFIMQVQKLGGTPPKKIWGPKTCKISVDFGPLQTLIANISRTAEDIQNRPAIQTMAIPLRFLADYFSAHRGCCAPKILHALEIDQALIAHTRSENLKFGLKFSVCTPITSGPVGVSPQNIFHTTCRQAGVITWV